MTYVPFIKTITLLTIPLSEQQLHFTKTLAKYDADSRTVLNSETEKDILTE